MNRIARAVADSKPQHVAKNMFGTARRKRIRQNAIKWITKARKLL